MNQDSIVQNKKYKDHVIEKNGKYYLELSKVLELISEDVTDLSGLGFSEIEKSLKAMEDMVKFTRFPGNQKKQQ